jgi:hypothetical protein
MRTKSLLLTLLSVVVAAHAGSLQFDDCGTATRRNKAIQVYLY